jgi:hypothetical protein
MSWFNIKPRQRAHARLAMLDIAAQIAAGRLISTHSERGETVLGLIEILERRGTPYTLIAVPGVGYLIGRHYPGDPAATKEYAERMARMTKTPTTNGEAHA